MEHVFDPPEDHSTKNVSNFIPSGKKISDLSNVECDQKKNSYNPFVIACALMIALNSFLPGYAIGILSGAVFFIKEDIKITEVQEEILVGSLSIISLLGSTVAARLSNSIGRKKAMAVGSLIFSIAAGGMAMASSFSMLLICRLLSGVGVGFAMLIVPVYLAEISPAKCRGAFVSLPEIFINIGILVAYVLNYVLSPLPARISWRLMVGLQSPIAAVLACSAFFVPESPRWLVKQCKIREAEQVLARFYAHKQQVDLILAEIKTAEGLSETGKANCESRPWREILKMRHMIMLVIGINFFQQVCGVGALVYYTPEIFSKARMNSKSELLAVTALVGLMKTLFVFVAILLIDRMGRRPLLLTSSLGMTATLVMVSWALFSLDSESNSKQVPSEIVVAMVAVCLFMAFFSIGFGPITGMVASETFPMNLRAQAANVGVMVNRIMSSIVALTFMSMARMVTSAGMFMLYAIMAALSAVFVHLMVPETKGRSLEEISQFFQATSTKESKHENVREPLLVRTANS